MTKMTVMGGFTPFELARSGLLPKDIQLCERVERDECDLLHSFLARMLELTSRAGCEREYGDRTPKVLVDELASEFVWRQMSRFAELLGSCTTGDRAAILKAAARAIIARQRFQAWRATLPCRHDLMKMVFRVGNEVMPSQKYLLIEVFLDNLEVVNIHDSRWTFLRVHLSTVEETSSLVFDSRTDVVADGFGTPNQLWRYIPMGKVGFSPERTPFASLQVMLDPMGFRWDLNSVGDGGCKVFATHVSLQGPSDPIVRKAMGSVAHMLREWIDLRDWSDERRQPVRPHEVRFEIPSELDDLMPSLDAKIVPVVVATV